MHGTLITEFAGFADATELLAYVDRQDLVTDRFTEIVIGVLCDAPIRNGRTA